MTKDDIEKLLGLSEGPTIDFNKKVYDLPNDRNIFIKDLLAMANTPRDHEAYIVCGVRWTPENRSQAIGLDAQYDDVRFQDVLGSGIVQPRPNFHYLPVEYQGKQLGIFRIHLGEDGPYTATKDYEGLQAGAIYFRRGSQNVRALGTEMRTICKSFMDKTTAQLTEITQPSWPHFLNTVQRFSTRNKFLLVVD